MKERIPAIDLLRGFVIIIMMIEHMVHLNPFIPVPSTGIGVKDYNMFIVVIRLISNICIPTFVMLCGISVFLREQSLGLSKKEIARHIFKRGLFLILLEITIISFGWRLVFLPYKIFLQAIFAIGCGLIFLSSVVQWKNIYILLCSLFVIFLDHIFAYLDLWNSFPVFIRSLLHGQSIFWFFSEKLMIKVTYPILSWIGVMGIGYFFGNILKNYANSKITMPLIFVILITSLVSRIVCVDDSILGIYMFLEVFNFQKYPPSLEFLGFFIPLCIILLRVLIKYNIRNKLLELIGRHSLFVYVVHIYILTVLYKIFT